MSGEVKRRYHDKTVAPPMPGPQPNSHTANRPTVTTDAIPSSKKRSPWTQNAWRIFGTIMALTFAIRLYRLGKPDQVVFDEVHFGGFASHYLKREYFFDVHPPLGKMLIAAIGYVAGFDGSFRFEKIGLDYNTGSAPYRFMRLMMILFGTGSIGFSVASLVEMGVSPIATAMAGILMAFAVYYGQQVKIKNKVEDIWLHSHEHRYPLHHDDGKVSSQGQQVTGYVDSDEEMDPNNIWIFHPASSEPAGRVPLKHGDTIRVFHPATNKYLMTHDVASPLTMTNQEVTMHEWSDEKKQKDMLFTIHITQNTSGAGSEMKSMSTQFKIVHVPTKVHINNHQLPLPKWGFEHREINGCKRGHKESSKWTVSAIMDSMTEAEEKDRSEKKKPKMTFLDKFIELQGAMVSSNSRLSDDHPFKSTAGTWPFVQRGIAFWDKSKKARIYLLGNPVGWSVALFGTVAIIVSLSKEAYLWRRGMSVREETATFRYLKQGGFLLMSYGLHYLPFFTMSRSLYLHHYLPAFMISCMITGVLLDHGLKTENKKSLVPLVLKATSAIVACCIVGAFVYFSPLTYGTDISTDALSTKKWVSTWDWP